MPYDDLDTMLDEELARMELFSEQVREAMRATMRDMEQEFRHFVDRVLGEQAGRLQQEAAALASQEDVPAFAGILERGLGGALRPASEAGAGAGGGALLGAVFGAALNAAAGSVLRGGALTPRSLANAGGRAIATQIGRDMFRTQTDQLRISRAQAGESALQLLTRARRNG